MLVACIAFVLIRSQRRAGELSPAAQMLLADQRWWERVRLIAWLRRRGSA